MPEHPSGPNDFGCQDEPFVLTTRQRIGERAIRDAIASAAEGRRQRLTRQHIVDRAASERAECPAVERFVQLIDDLIQAQVPRAKMVAIADAIRLYILSGYPMDETPDLHRLKRACVNETRAQSRGDECQDRVKVATRVDLTEVRAVVETAGVHRRALEEMELVGVKIIQRVGRST